jgi:ATPase subunit of ABC transporter with duplicated ATPase domains
MDTSSNAHRIALMIKRLEREIDDLEDKMSVFLEDKLYDFKLENNRNQDLEVFEMLKFTNVELSYNSKVIFKNLNFSLNSDEVVSIVGSNGSGKTTFFKLIMKLINPDSGTVEVDSKTKPIFIPQEISYENDRMTVFEYVKHISGLGDEYAISAILRLFDNDEEYIKKRVFTLSGGEQKRLQIYTHMVGDSNLMLIDEPTTFMDEYTKIKILELIKDYQGAVILVTHEKKVRDMLNVTTYNLIDKKLDLFRKEMN